jgi:hypothetical protein
MTEARAADTVESLKAALEEVNTDIARIKSQLETARAKKIATGEYSDPLWYAKASGALRFKQRESQTLQAKLGELKKQRRDQAFRVEARFVEIARRRLDPVLFQEIKDEAETEKSK